MNEYESPEIYELGSVADLTLGSATGNHLDSDFPAGTDFGDLTFSG